MKEKEKKYIIWYEGKTFSVPGLVNSIKYRLEECNGELVNIKWEAVGTHWLTTETCRLGHVFDYIKSGHWVLND